ncbi:MAG: hydrogenase maturation nickel metallochaperone HypA [Oscillibacter sp.]|nr:hydrogenase maturation nickel metallochaperone HypA [Oscillibacter sp.]
MRMVRCEDCGRRYDYEEDGFCPRCGAFNQPSRSASINANGEVVRVDGLSEAGHADSFVHQEFHEEEKARRRSGLDKGVRRIPRPRPTVSKPQTDRDKRAQPVKTASNIVSLVIFLVVVLNLLRACMYMV